MDFDDFLESKNTIAIVCNQWGDTGKGKFVDLFASWANIIVRGTGGANAGHTIILNSKKYVFHLVPSGILYDSEGKINILGSGVAFDPRAFIEELNVLDDENKTYKNLRVSLNAKLVLPQHILLDRLKEHVSGSGKIGTTGRGIGPLYIDHCARIGLTVNDILNKEIFIKKLKRNLDEKLKYLKNFDKEIVKEILNHAHLENGAFYSEESILNLDKIIEYYTEIYKEKLKDMITDTDEFVRNNKGNKKILLEGAQGLLLSIDHGSYPYVTASDTTISGLAKGSGLSEKDVDLTLGIVKAFYMTRVGAGPFPTEMGGEESELHCSSSCKDNEEKEHPNASLNDNNEFTQGIAVRFNGAEYGATTGRPRRTGWLDLPLLRRAILTNGNKIILTKIDVLSKCEKIKLCDAYEYEGDDFYYGNILIHKGDTIRTAIVDSNILSKCKPIYSIHEGWLSDISEVLNYEDLPKNLKKIIEYIEIETASEVKIVSVGPERDQTIIVK